ncbi:DUF6491 family protein [Caulobacter sp. KR2-114]|uniref:DUF6491 family protein n=1 Tax=Caulobacter sp. KR2-114 TaxID=3400912 RepID=UPI003BFBFC37
MRKTHLISMAGIAGLAALVCAPNAMPEPSKAGSTACFFSRDWDGWKASADSKAIYIRVSHRDVYRLDLSSACPDLHYPNAHLVTKMHGDTICNALDIDLKVSSGDGFAVPCIVSHLTQLSKAEADALPKELQP